MALVKIPKKLPLLLIQSDILLPGSPMRLPISGPLSTNMVKSRLLSRNSLSNSIVGVVTVEDVKEFESNVKSGKHRAVGTAAVVLQVASSAWHRGTTYTLALSGLCRFSLDQLVMEEPYPVGVVTQIDYFSPDAELMEKGKELVDKVRKQGLTLLERSDPSHPVFHDITNVVKDSPSFILPDLLMSLITTTYEQKKEVLNALDIEDRLTKVSLILQHFLQKCHRLKLVKKGELGLPRTEVIVLAIPSEQKMLRARPKDADNSGDVADGFNEIDELNNKIEKANLPTDVGKIVMRDLNRLKKMGPFSPEHGIIRNYIEFVVELPWTISSTETIDIQKARKDLDEEHYGLERVKQRVLEYLAVRQLRPSVRGPILCFVGPPGVGKTSVGRSIARTLARQFQRISLGGVSNQVEVRGHRRTYIGAMPGRIIQAIKSAGVNNPVILLDEIDKMSTGVHGDPAAALLEVLDPLQNHNFLDHYLNMPFDLSQVTFIATANRAANIPPPLLDRMETISVSGYTLEEKTYIADHHLLPKQLKENGLDSNLMKVPVESIKHLILSYTSEAGVRALERKLAALCRAVAVKVAENSDGTLAVPVEITCDGLEEILGPPQYAELEVSGERTGAPGVAVGLAWTEQGGCLTLVEASRLAGGEGRLVLTGHLGSVMKESAQLALNWVRGVAHRYGLSREGDDLTADTDVHIHFPAGAVGKEGPSAGVTIATALVSLFSGVPLVSGLAISGELTLRGNVLPVGGVREKLLAAHRAGLRKVILPKLCIKDLFYVPQSVKNDMSFLFVERMEEVIDAAFDGLVSCDSQTHSSFQSRL